jgi:hypothetical protein
MKQIRYESKTTKSFQNLKKRQLPNLRSQKAASKNVLHKTATANNFNLTWLTIPIKDI